MPYVHTFGAATCTGIGGGCLYGGLRRGCCTKGGGASPVATRCGTGGGASSAVTRCGVGAGFGTVTAPLGWSNITPAVWCSGGGHLTIPAATRCAGGAFQVLTLLIAKPLPATLAASSFGGRDLYMITLGEAFLGQLAQANGVQKPGSLRSRVFVHHGLGQAGPKKHRPR
jgi:hypothetical protein